MNVYHKFLRNGKCVDSGKWLSRSDMLRPKCFLQGTPTENNAMWCAAGNRAAQEVERLGILEEMSGEWVKGLFWE